MSNQKRVIAMHDISCVGKCSLTVALPILSSAGIECSVLPTAVLSTHTGGFSGFTFLDLTDQIMPIVNHWKTLNLSVQSIYTGYLGSAKQLELAENLFDTFKDSKPLILVDPVMADNGKMYTGFDLAFAKGMARLCCKADIIVPNITEATFMLGEPYVEGPYTEQYISDLLKRLSNLVNTKIVLTGVCFDEQNIGAASYDNVTGKISYYMSHRVNSCFHGTGDVFASALLSAILRGISLENSMKIAVDFVFLCIQQTVSDSKETRYGVNFESQLKNLIGMIENLAK